MEQLVVDFIHKAWGSKDYFPGPQPVSIERRHFDILRKNWYCVCEKTDGERYIFVANTFNGQRKSFLVNRSWSVIEVHLNLRPHAYDGTILDGELYENELFVYDALLVNGHCVGHLNFMDRYESIEKFLKTIIYMKKDPYRLRLKKMHAFTDFDDFAANYLTTVKQNVDGLVFTPVYEPVRLGTHETLFKWKPRDQNTVDFQMKWDECRNCWRLYAQEKGKLFYETDFLGDTQDWFEEDCIAECACVANSWVPIKRRYDKNYPNNRRTLFRTIVNIKENIQMTEFSLLASQIATTHG